MRAQRRSLRRNAALIINGIIASRSLSSCTLVTPAAAAWRAGAENRWRNIMAWHRARIWRNNLNSSTQTQRKWRNNIISMA